MKVIIGLSGGVDSSVSAALLVRQGYDVTGIFMKNWSAPIAGQNVCPWEEDAADARAVADSLGIPFYVLSFEKEYKKRVVDYMVREYRLGRTPNPDIVCNAEIKFKLFFEKALSLGADYIATGHYARIRKPNSGSTKHQARNTKQNKKFKNLDIKTLDIVSNFEFRISNFQLLRGADKEKDQSYFLARIDPKVLEKILFPIGHLTKPEVRELARKFRLHNAEKKDSTGVCFIGEFSMRDFLKENFKAKSGRVIDIDTGQVLGTHQGANLYTIGQRHGFGPTDAKALAGKGGGGQAYYVCAKDMEANIVFVAPGRAHKSLLSKEIEVEDIHWLTQPRKNTKITAKLRYRGEEYRVKELLTTHHSPLTTRVIFHDPVWASAPGQSVVFYDGDVCLGGAVIN